MAGSGRPALFGRLARRRLTWWPDLGVGYYPVEAGYAPYDVDYFERFARQAETEIGRALMAARVEFVARHYSGPLIDIGIGSGAFVAARPAEHGPTAGYDVNPEAMSWLRQRDLWCDPYAGVFPAVTLWDVLEHIPDFDRLLGHVSRWCFVSLPIFRDAEHCLASKHGPSQRATEHVWHFTAPGLISVMDGLGFDLVEQSDIETRIGREDIGTFAFRRR